MRPTFFFFFTVNTNVRLMMRFSRAPTKVHVFDGMPHGFYVFGDLGMTKRWDEVMHESIRWTGAGDGEWVIER